MPVEIHGIKYFGVSEVLKSLNVTRQTLWRWRQEGKIPPGHRYRARQVVFSPAEVKAIQEFANRIEPIENPNANQLRLFNNAELKS
jgi:predicted DNA-binding transcriptional regulator AlpA